MNAALAKVRTAHAKALKEAQRLEKLLIKLEIQRAARVSSAACQSCGRPIPDAEIRAYQSEAGSCGSLPRVCEDCAERVSE